MSNIFQAYSVTLSEVDFWAAQRINGNLRMIADNFQECTGAIAVKHCSERSWEQPTDGTMCYVVSRCHNLSRLELIEGAMLTDSFLLHMAQCSLTKLVVLCLEHSPHITDTGAVPLLIALRSYQLQKLSFRNCSALTDVTLRVFAEVFAVHCFYCLIIAGTQMSKETLLQLIFQGKMQMARGIIVCNGASWIRDQLKAAGFANPRLVQDG